MILSQTTTQRPETTTFMAITSVALDVEMSTPSDKPLSIEQKADLYGNLIQWTQNDLRPTTISLTSPTSGNVYTISYSQKTGEWQCNCKAKGRCYHLVSFERHQKYFLAMGNIVMEERVSVYSQTIPIQQNGFSSHEAFLAQRRKDFGG